jgi:hypothetical protein
LSYNVILSTPKDIGCDSWGWGGAFHSKYQRKNQPQRDIQDCSYVNDSGHGTALSAVFAPRKAVALIGDGSLFI